MLEILEKHPSRNNFSFTQSPQWLTNGLRTVWDDTVATVTVCVAAERIYLIYPLTPVNILPFSCWHYQMVLASFSSGLSNSAAHHDVGFLGYCMSKWMMQGIFESKLNKRVVMTTLRVPHPTMPKTLFFSLRLLLRWRLGQTDVSWMRYRDCNPKTKSSVRSRRDVMQRSVGYRCLISLALNSQCFSVSIT